MLSASLSVDERFPVTLDPSTSEVVILDNDGTCSFVCLVQRLYAYI